jgi:hypothetical protein
MSLLDVMQEKVLDLGLQTTFRFDHCKKRWVIEVWLPVPLIDKGNETFFVVREEFLLCPNNFEAACHTIELAGKLIYHLETFHES